jgi:hypothetical protein
MAPKGAPKGFIDYSDDTAFIFSLTNSTKHVPESNKDKAVRHTSQRFLIVMG